MTKVLSAKDLLEFRKLRGSPFAELYPGDVVQVLMNGRYMHGSKLGSTLSFDKSGSNNATDEFIIRGAKNDGLPLYTGTVFELESARDWNTGMGGARGTRGTGYMVCRNRAPEDSRILLKHLDGHAGTDHLPLCVQKSPM